MPLQNRVSPCGEVFASPARGTLTGNRGGAIHNDTREIVRQFKSRRWITCRLEFKGRRRTVMSPGRYTELFFLDEAVSFAAGHRPCAECRRDRFNAFRDAWMRSSPARSILPPSADQMDAELHRHRISPQGRKVTHPARLDSLPDGSFIGIDGSSYLVFQGAILLWSPQGYQEKLRRQSDSNVTVLTPEPVVECIRHGYTPEIHPSALAL